MSKKIGMVISSHPDASDAGIEVLKNGGNAFDAAVAASFMVCVVDPANTSIGGYGGSLVAYSSELDRVFSINFDSRAPAKARADMFELISSSDGSTSVKDDANIFGANSVGVPGILRGLDLALKKYGTMPISRVVSRSIETARKGFVVNESNSSSILEVIDPLRRDDFKITAKLMMPKGRAPKAGEVLANPELSESLSIIADEGVDSFYSGSLCSKIVEYLDSCGGLLAEEEMQRYRPIESKPLAISYHGYRIHTPPLCSGGLSSLQILKVAENLSVAKAKQRSAEYFHSLLEIMKLCWRERLSKLGDPEFIQLDQKAQLSGKIIEELSDEARISIENTGRGQILSTSRKSSTSHICASDVEGNFVSMTHTLGGSLGSLMTVPGTGIVLGHGVSRFDPRPGHPNSVGPQKQPLHNMCPMLMTKDDQIVAAFGVPGGRTIVNNMVQFVLDMVDYAMSPRTALAFPRIHVESAEPVQVEASIGKPMIAKLRKLGHEVKSVKRIGGPAHIIMKRSDNSLIGATDPRDEGKVARTVLR